MMDDDDAAEQLTVAADDLGATAVAPLSMEAEPQLAWSLDNGSDTGPAQRQPWRLAWVQAGVFASIGAVCAVVIGVVGWVFIRAHDDPRAATPVAHRAGAVMQTGRSAPPAAAVAAPSTVTVEATPPTVTVKATPPTVTVRDTPPTVTVEAAPPRETVPDPVSVIPSPPRSSIPAPGEVDSVYDQRFLDQMRSLGYVIVNRQLLLRNAHEACRLLRQGESTGQVNQEMSQRMGTSMSDTLQLTSSAMLTYPDCY